MRITVDNLNFSYPQKKVLNNICFHLQSGDFLTIVGKNGSGKSTLIKCILGLLKVSDKTIYLDDIDINVLKKLYNVSYVPQKVDFNYEFPITVKEILSTAYNKRHLDSHFFDIVNQLELNTFYNDNINNLSGGQLQRVFIARSLLNNPKLLILDEPTVGIDSINLIALEKMLEKLKEKQITIILVTHDKDFASNLTDYYLQLEENDNYSFSKVGSL